MYLRRLHHGSNVLSSPVGVQTVTRSKVLSFSSLHQRLEQPVFKQSPSRQLNSESGRNYGDKGHPEAKGFSTRPFTVLALCVPLGYGLNWALKSANDDAGSIDTDGFVKYTLTNKERVSSTSSIFTLKPAASSTIRTDDESLKRLITSVQFKQPQLQIARNYTLLPPREGQNSQELSFLIRKETNGEVSGYLHRLPIGSSIELRGLSAEYILPEHVSEVVFLAGGTGIAPAMQVASALAAQAQVHILWANRRRDDCVGGKSDTIQETKSSLKSSVWLRTYLLPFSRYDMKDDVVISFQKRNAIVSDIERLKELSNMAELDHERKTLIVDYYVDEENNYIQPKDVQRLLWLTNNSEIEHDSSLKKLLFVAGPEGFVNHWAAPKQWIGGREVQGHLGGVLSTLNLGEWEVIKL